MELGKIKSDDACVVWLFHDYVRCLSRFRRRLPCAADGIFVKVCPELFLRHIGQTEVGQLFYYGLRQAGSYYAGRIAGHDGVGRHVVRHHGTGCYDGFASDVYTVQDDGSGAQPGPVVHAGLSAAYGIGRMMAALQVGAQRKGGQRTRLMVAAEQESHATGYGHVVPDNQLVGSVGKAVHVELAIGVTPHPDGLQREACGRHGLVVRVPAAPGALVAGCLQLTQQ